jgi:uncharacterized membrane protein YjgN (DUF898 family)
VEQSDVFSEKPMFDWIAPVGAPVSPPESARFAFNGRAGEYFRIWIVNVFLSIVTLGIYSAWAKVRIKRYVYGHTLLGDLPFAYDANPWAILRGRLVAAALVGLWFGLGYVSPLAQLALLVPVAFLLPWLIVGSLRFKMRASSYRNVGFSFDGTYGNAFTYYSVYPVLAAITLYLLWPWVVFRQRSWAIESASWGNRRLGFWGKLSDFHLAYVPMLAGVLLLGVLVASAPDESKWPASYMTAMLIVYALFIAMSYWTRAFVQKIVLDSMYIGGARLVCTMMPLRYTWIVLSNWILALVTLGMLHPWGEVRRLKYLTSQLVVAGFETLEDARGERAQAGSAAGAETVDAFDIDAGF